MKSFLTCIALFLSALLSAFAQSPAPLPMIASQEAIKTWAIESVRSIAGDVRINSLLPAPDTVQSIAMSATSADDALEKYAAAQFKIKAASSEDLVTSFVNLQDKKGNELFYGFGSGTIHVSQTPQGEVWTVGEISIKLHLSEYVMIPLPVSDVLNAYIIYRDENGNYQWSQDLWVYNGYFSFPTAYAEKVGQLVFETGKDYPVQATVYGLSTGKVAPTPLMTFGVGTGIDNYASFDDAKGFSGSILMQAYAGWNHTAPVVKIKVSKPTNVGLACRIIDEDTGEIIERPVSGKYRLQGSTTETAWSGSNLSLTPGTYYLWWDTESFIEEPQEPWDNGKG